MEVAPGEGSPWEEQFSDDYSNLNISEQEKINNDVTAEAIKMVNEVFGTNLSGAVHGTGGWELYQNPSSVEQMFSSKENAKKAAAMLGYLLNQTEVWVNTAKELTKNPKFAAASAGGRIAKYDDHHILFTIGDFYADGTLLDIIKSKVPLSSTI